MAEMARYDLLGWHNAHGHLFILCVQRSNDRHCPSLSCQPRSHDIGTARKDEGLHTLLTQPQGMYCQDLVFGWADLVF